MADTPEQAALRRTVLRLKRIGGQVEGITRMIEEDRFCVDVLTQISAVQAALSNAGVEVLERHLQTRVAKALASPDAAERQQAVDGLVEVISRSAALLR